MQIGLLLLIDQHNVTQVTWLGNIMHWHSDYTAVVLWKCQTYNINWWRHSGRRSNIIYAWHTLFRFDIFVRTALLHPGCWGAHTVTLKDMSVIASHLIQWWVGTPLQPNQLTYDVKRWLSYCLKWRIISYGWSITNHGFTSHTCSSLPTHIFIFRVGSLSKFIVDHQSCKSLLLLVGWWTICIEGWGMLIVKWDLIASSNELVERLSKLQCQPRNEWGRILKSTVGFFTDLRYTCKAIMRMYFTNNVLIIV